MARSGCGVLASIVDRALSGRTCPYRRGWTCTETSGSAARRSATLSARRATPAYPAANHRACVGMCGDGVSAALDVRDERCAKARLLLLVVLGRVVELARAAAGNLHPRRRSRPVLL